MGRRGRGWVMNRISILGDIQVLKQEIDLLEELMRNLDINPSSFEEMVFKKYIETESISKVTKFLRENGYKKQGSDGRHSYKSEDIREIILNDKANVPEVLIHFCKTIFNRNRKAVKKYYG